MGARGHFGNSKNKRYLGTKYRACHYRERMINVDNKNTFKCLLVRLKNEQYEVGFMGENRKDNRQIKFRVSDHEYEELEQTANNFHMIVPAFAKKRALGYRMKPPKVDNSGAIEIAKQLREIGNNVNQLRKRGNASNGKIDSEDLQAIKKELHKIWQQFN